MAKVLGVGGIFFKSPEPHKLGQWYSHWLGINLEPQPDMTFAVFLPGTMPKNGYTVWSPFASDTTYFSPSDNDFMFNLVIDDLEQALNQVRAGGGVVVGDVENSAYSQFGWFIDPDGNKVELWQAPGA